MPRDLYDLEEIKITMMVLSESVAARLRQSNLQCETVQVSASDLSWIERQGKLIAPCCESESIYTKALELLAANHKIGKPIRSLGVRGCNLMPRQYAQTSFAPDVIHAQKHEVIEDVLDGLRGRFGNKVVQRGVMLSDRALSALDPQTDHPNLVLSNVHSQR
jgi:DNA polymerase-4